ncbi:MAG: hypothetical protein ACK5MN_06190 [Lachnospiraceae bacterium]
MSIKKWTAALSLLAAFLYVFHMVYNYFGHGVESLAMNTVWIFPLGLLLLLWLLYLLMRKAMATNAGKNACRLFLSATITLIIARILTGVFEIAGTGSSYLLLYYLLAAGLGLIGIGFLFYAGRRRLQTSAKRQSAS